MELPFKGPRVRFPLRRSCGAHFVSGGWVMIRKFAVAVAAFAVLIAADTGTAKADDKKPIEIKLGTLAPRDSAWGGVFRAWAKAVKEESNGAVELTWFFNAQQGDEKEMIGKSRSKQIAGGAFTAT